MVRLLAVYLSLSTLSTPLISQSDPDTFAAASQTYFLVNGEHASGGSSSSATYALDASQGSGLVAQPAASSSYRLVAGFFGSADIVASGAPWLAGTVPRFVTMRGVSNLTVHGTELNLGGPPNVSIGGQPAGLLGTPSRVRIGMTVPIQPSPGWQSVRLTTPRGTTELPRGIGVLPMIYTDPAATSNKEFAVVFKGTQGDRITWALGITSFPSPVPLGGIWHGLLLNPLSTLPGLGILDANGELRVTIAPARISVPVFLQAVFATSNPGYAPAAFSNLLVIYP